jgi:ParB-like chromosome segregation protein Spo0J
MTELNLADLSKYKIIPLDKLVEASWNYKEDNDKLIDTLVANLKRNGQVENIIVRLLDTGFYEVVNGNHRLTAFRKIGMEKAVCYDLGSVSLSEAKRLALETNETKFAANRVKMADILSEISSSFSLDDMSETLPFDSEQIQNMIDASKMSWEDNDLTNTGADEDEAKLTNLKMTPAMKMAWDHYYLEYQKFNSNATIEDAFIAAVEKGA